MARFDILRILTSCFVYLYYEVMAVKDGSKKGIASLALLEVGLFELGFVVVVIGIFLLVLNYFNILSLSQLYPNQLGSLPHQLKEDTLISPVKEGNLTRVEEWNNFILYYIKEGSSVFASSQGFTSHGGGSYGMVKPPQNFKIVWITRSDGKRIEYRFIGDPVAPGQISTNDFIVRVGQEGLKAYKNASLVVTLYNSKGEIEPLSTKDFKARK